jgi:DNA-binding Lrp family transcriptional regulator
MMVLKHISKLNNIIYEGLLMGAKEVNKKNDKNSEQIVHQKEILDSVLSLGARAPIDDTDSELIQQLVKNGRLTNVELAQILNTSEGTIRRRIQTLIDRGFIRGFTTLLNYNLFGYVIKAHIDFQVEKQELDNVANMLIEKGNICSLYRVIGDYNLSTVVVFKNVAELQEFLDLFTEMESVNKISYLIVADSYKPCYLTGI